MIFKFHSFSRFQGSSNASAGNFPGANGQTEHPLPQGAPSLSVYEDLVQALETHELVRKAQSTLVTDEAKTNFRKKFVGFFKEKLLEILVPKSHGSHGFWLKQTLLSRLAKDP